MLEGEERVNTILIDARVLHAHPCSDTSLTYRLLQVREVRCPISLISGLDTCVNVWTQEIFSGWFPLNPPPTSSSSPFLLKPRTYLQVKARSWQLNKHTCTQSCSSLLASLSGPNRTSLEMVHHVYPPIVQRSLCLRARLAECCMLQ